MRCSSLTLFEAIQLTLPHLICLFKGNVGLGLAKFVGLYKLALDGNSSRIYEDFEVVGYAKLWLIWPHLVMSYKGDVAL